MAQIGKKLRNSTNNRLHFFCPGCNEPHHVSVSEKGWKWNGDADKPTFSPSVLVTSGHYAAGHVQGDCWCTFNERRPENRAGFKCSRCHSFVADGNIQFLADCTHALVGKTVELPDLPDYLRDP